MGKLEVVYSQDSPTQWGVINRFGRFAPCGKHKPTQGTPVLIVGKSMYQPGRLDGLATLKSMARHFRKMGIFSRKVRV